MNEIKPNQRMHVNENLTDMAPLPEDTRASRGLRVRLRREALGLTLEEAGAAAGGMTAQQFLTYEQGARAQKPQRARIARALRTTEADLFPAGSDSKPRRTMTEDGMSDVAEKMLYDAIKEIKDELRAIKERLSALENARGGSQQAASGAGKK